MPFGLCNVLATFQRLRQNYLGKLNLIYCLIYLDDVIVFLQTTVEHFHRLCMVFDQFREYNLKLELSKWSLFKEEINYLAHWVSKQGVWPSDTNLMAIAECMLPQTYMKICAFLGLVGQYQGFIKGFAWIAQSLNEHLAGEGASRKTEWVLLSEDSLEAFQALKQACMSSTILAFTDYTRDFLLETDTSKEGLEWYSPKNEQMDDITWLPMVAKPSLLMKRTIIWPNLSPWHWNGPSWNTSRNTCCTSPS